VNDDPKDLLHSLSEASLEAQLRAVRRLRQGPSKVSASHHEKGLSQVEMAYDILKKARSPLRVSDLLARIRTTFHVSADHESLVSSWTKKVARGDRFPRTDKNTQPANRPRLSAQGRLPAVLEIQLASLDGDIPGLLAPPNHAQPHRAHEADRPYAARSPRAVTQLLQGPKAVLQRRGRGSEQQSQGNHEKIVRLPDLPYPGTRALSLTWPVAGAGAYP